MRALEYPDPTLADDTVALRPWVVADIACVMEGKGYGHDDALAWIADQWERQSDGAGIGLAIADPNSGEALGCISLLYRPQAGPAPTRDGSGTGLVFEPDSGPPYGGPRSPRCGVGPGAVRRLPAPIPVREVPVLNRVTMAW
jgi:hypothetical protein